MMIKEAIANADLKSIALSYGVDLKEHNGRVFGKCPFHADKDPSFYIFTSKRPHKFKCFGCGIHGDAADFIEKQEGISTFEAFKRLGVTMDKSEYDEKYAKDKKAAISEFTNNVRSLGWLLNDLCKMWTKAQKDQGVAMDHPQGYFYENLWGYWMRQLALGDNETKHEVLKTATVKKLVSQIRDLNLGWL